MTRSRRIALWLTGVVLVALMLAFSLSFLLTRLIASETFKERLIERICMSVGGPVAFDKLEISLLPEPHIAASGVRIDLPGGPSGTIEALSLVPRILPLLSGRLEPAELLVAAPRIKMPLPDLSTSLPPGDLPPPASDTSPTPREPDTRRPALSAREAASEAQSSGPGRQDTTHMAPPPSSGLSWPDLEARLLSLLKAWSETAPGLHLRVERGRLAIVHEAQPVLSVHDLAAWASLPPDLLTLRLECQSDFWSRLAFDGWFDPADAKSGGHLRLDHVRSQLAGERFPAGLVRPAGDSPVDLDITFSSQGAGLWEAAFQASSPSLTLQRGSHQTLIREASLEGMLQKEGEKFELRVSRLHAAVPQLELTGRFQSHPDTPELAYEVDCRNADAAAIREAALALMGENEVVKDIFTFIRGGLVPQVTFEARGRSVAELKDSRTLVVKGRLEKGEVFVPKPGLDIGEVYGDVLIANDILEGTDLQGITGQSIGRRGSLTVALAPKDGPFHLDIEIDAYLAQLPSVLARVVDNQAFLRELALVRDVSGTAHGRLLLGDRLNRIVTRVEVADWKLKAFYERLPFPLALEASALVYEERQLAVAGLQGQIGRSTVQDVSGMLTWDQELELELTSPAKGEFLLDEFFPWLLTFSPIRENRWQIQSLEGGLRMESLKFRGPMAKPAKWRFALTGLLQNATAVSSLLGNPLKINSGSLFWTPQNLDVGKWELAFLDSSLTVSGRLSSPAADQPSAEFSGQGTSGPQAAEWLADRVQLPPELRVRTPLSLIQSRFALDRSGCMTLAGTFRTADGPELSLELDGGGDELFIKRLQIDDQESKAHIIVKLKRDEVGLGFQGNLTGGTLGRMLAANSFFKGSITGDFSAQLFKDRLADSTAKGQLALRDFSYVAIPRNTLMVDEALLEGGEHAVVLKSAAIRLQDEALKLKGTLGTSPKHLLLDLELTAKDLDWDRLQTIELLKHLGDTASGGTTADGLAFRGIPVRGALRVLADHFTYADFTWKPIRANLTFAPDGPHIEVTEARLCSIPTPGRLIPHPQGSVLIIHPAARNLDLDTALACLFDRKGFITGTFDLDGEITARAQPEEMSQTFRGNVIVEARDGHVYHSPVLSKIFTLINVTEIYRGQVPDLMHEGCAYDSIKAQATLKNRKILVENAVFDGHCAKMVWTGEVDLASQRVDFTVLVSPFKTVDALIRSVPLLGSILGGTLVTIPVRVAGDLRDPGVTSLPPTAVGSGLLNTMKKVLQFPFTLQQPGQ